MANKKITNTGLLNLSALIRQAKNKHSAFFKKDNVNDLPKDDDVFL